MAPVCLACHLMLSCLFVWMFSWISNCCALLVYNRQPLLDISTSFMDVYKSDVEHVFNNAHGSFITDMC